MEERRDSLHSVPATVAWTCVAIYPPSLSACLGGPALGITAILEQLTVIPSFCLCETSSSPSMSSPGITPRTST